MRRSILTAAFLLSALCCAGSANAQWGYGGYGSSYSYGYSYRSAYSFGPGFYNPHNWGPTDYVYPTRKYARPYVYHFNQFAPGPSPSRSWRWGR